MRTRPPWLDWDLELSPHLLKRMTDRRFTEIELRDMLHTIRGYRRDIVEGRWVIDTMRRRRRWKIIVEPDLKSHLLVVVTAYPAAPK